MPSNTKFDNSEYEAYVVSFTDGVQSVPSSWMQSATECWWPTRKPNHGQRPLPKDTAGWDLIPGCKILSSCSMYRLF